MDAHGGVFPERSMSARKEPMNSSAHCPRDGNRDDSQDGFSLIEVAIVLVIIGIIAGSGMSLIGTLTEKRTRNECRDYMSLAKESLLSHVNINGSLPYASEDTDGTADDGETSGYLPYVDLKLKPTDSYGRVLKYEINELLVADEQTTCEALADGLEDAPSVVDSDGATFSIPVAVVLVSAGPMDSDSDGDVFDMVEGSFQGDNTTGVPNYIRHPAIDTFDDLVLYIGEGELYSEADCSGIRTWIVRVENNSNREAFLHNVTYPSKLVCSGRIGKKQAKIFKVEDGDAVELKDGLDYLSSDHMDSYPRNTPRVITHKTTLSIKPFSPPPSGQVTPGS